MNRAAPMYWSRNDGRHGERRGDVVEAVHLDLGRQQVLHLDLDAQQRAHGVGVFGAVQALRGHVSGARGLLAGVEAALQPGDQGVVLRLRGLLAARRRHQVAAQLAHRGLPELGVLRDVRLAQRVEGDATRPVGGVVAFGAVVLQASRTWRARRRSLPQGCGTAGQPEEECQGAREHSTRLAILDGHGTLDRNPGHRSINGCWNNHIEAPTAMRAGLAAASRAIIPG